MSMTTIEQWLLEGAVRDPQTVTARWTPSSLNLIEGVRIREIDHVPKPNGYLTEMFRTDWRLDGLEVDQIFQVVLNPGAISAWHAHEFTTDRLFINHGLVQIALYDAREQSATRGTVNDFRFGTVRPALVVIPPRVWHGLRNISDRPSSILNMVDRAYDYEDPDHWRVPHDSAEIPFRW
jgi:dTDP-4-dehydrorhamnose 3,5-epimerase